MHVKNASFDQAFVDGLRKEFRDWWVDEGKESFNNHPAFDYYISQSAKRNPQDQSLPLDTDMDEYRAQQDHFRRVNNEIKRRGAIGWWPNIENFLKSKYPAAHKNFEAGWEEAGYQLDNSKPDKAYATGPEAVAQHGYDPSEIAAGMLMLHNQSHPLRGRLEDTDKQRLVDIFQKRQQMQQAHEQKQKSLVTAALTQDIVDRLGKEFDDWWGEREHIDHPFAWPGRGPIGHWPNVEDFLYDKYPAAHRGLDMGYEETEPILAERPWEEDDWGHQQYATGPEAVAQYGYDPKEIAAGMLLLHNQTHPFRGHLAQEDQDRLVDIFQKRQKMQRDFDRRMKQQGEQQAFFTKEELLNPEKQKELVTAAKQLLSKEQYGNCYEAAAKYMMANTLFAGSQSNKNLRLVHGEVRGQGPMEGKTFGHAWIEDGNDVIDNSNGRNLRIPKLVYYHFGDIHNLNNYHVYKPTEARDKMLETGIFGPWDLKGKHPNYVEGPEFQDDEDDDDGWHEDDDWDGEGDGYDEDYGEAVYY